MSPTRRYTMRSVYFSKRGKTENSWRFPFLPKIMKALLGTLEDARLKIEVMHQRPAGADREVQKKHTSICSTSANLVSMYGSRILFVARPLCWMLAQKTALAHDESQPNINSLLFMPM